MKNKNRKLTVKEFIKTYHHLALQTEKKWGIPALFVLAQAALETGWGEFVVANNLFGIKASKNTPVEDRVNLLTKEYIEGEYRTIRADFRQYDCAEDAFHDHAKLLAKGARYAVAMNYASDAYSYAQAIAMAGYATDPQYASKLKQLIKMLDDAL